MSNCLYTYHLEVEFCNLSCYQRLIDSHSSYHSYLKQRRSIAHMQCSQQFLLYENPTDERSCFELSIKSSCQCVVRGVLFSTVSNWETGSLLNFTEWLELNRSSGDHQDQHSCQGRVTLSMLHGNLYRWVFGLQRWQLYGLPQQPVPVLCHPQWKEIPHVEVGVLVLL